MRTLSTHTSSTEDQVRIANHAFLKAMARFLRGSLNSCPVNAEHTLSTCPDENVPQNFASRLRFESKCFLENLFLLIIIHKCMRNTFNIKGISSIYTNCWKYNGFYYAFKHIYIKETSNHSMKRLILLFFLLHDHA